MTNTASRRIAPLLGAIIAAAMAVGIAAAAAGMDRAPRTASASSSPTTGDDAQAGRRWVSGYYVGYQRALYPPEQVDFSLMTHIIVGPVLPTASGGVQTHFDIDPTRGPAMARTLSTRAHRAGKRAILMLGGSGSRPRFVRAASPANRARFVSTLLATMDELGYDGIDVDWEPIEPADKEPLLALLRELRARRPRMLITIPVETVNTNFGGGVDAWYGRAAAVVDQMNIMSYSMSGAWNDWHVWHHAPLADEARDRPVSVSSTVQRYLRAGVPAAKLGIGLGFYGSCWRNASAPRERQRPGTALVAQDNAMSYTNIMTRYYQADAYRWDAAASAPYLTFNTPRGPQRCNLISYENERSIAAKGAFARSRGLGGAIVWTIGQGHLPGAPAGRRDPLLAAAHQAFVGR